MIETSENSNTFFGLSVASFVFGMAALCGLFFTWSSYERLATWNSMQSWMEVPATLKELDRDEGFISTRYSYTVDGVEYESTRLQVASNSRQVYATEFQRMKKLVWHLNAATCYVDPRDHGSAVLLRDSPPLEFALLLLPNFIFGSIGVFGFVGIVYAIRRWRADVQREREFPNSPWKWEKMWIGNRVTSCQANKLFWSGFIPIWWLITVIPLSIRSAVSVWQGETLSLLGLLPLLATVVVGLFSFRYWLKNFEMGEAVLELAEVPIEPDAPTTMACVFSTRQTPAGPVTVRVTRLDSLIVSMNETQTRTDWKKTLVLNEKEWEIVNEKLCIAIPLRLPSVRPENPFFGHESRWVMKLWVPTRYGNLKVTFRLPVFESVKSKEKVLIP